MTETNLGLRERKKDATRRALSAMALRLAVSKGYDGFTIAELADEVGISRRTFSNYFTNKAECLAGAIEGMITGVFEAIPEFDPELGFMELIVDVVANVDDEALRDFEEFAQILAVVPELQSQVYVLDLQAAAQTSAEIVHRYGLDPADLRIELLAALVIAAARTCIQRWTCSGRPNGRTGLRQLLQQAMSIFDRKAVEQILNP